jgi:hypothetical protein
MLKYILLIIGITLQYGCVTEPENDYINFKIKVDKLTHPDTVSVNDTLTIVFDGYVGSNGCHRFSHIAVNKELNEIEITVWGTKPNFDAICTTALVYLDGQEYKTLLKQKGIQRIIVNQPDNSTLLDSVFVE